MLITSPDPYRLQRLLAREKARRAVIVRVGVTEVEPGLWAAEVSLLKPIRPGWVKPVAIATGVVGAGTALGWMLWLIVSAIATVAATISFAAALGVLAVLLLILQATRSRGCETTVTVKHRHPR